MEGTGNTKEGRKGEALDWRALDGLRLGGLSWQPAGRPRFVVICLHGMGGMAEDFEPLGCHLACLGGAVYAPNLRGQARDPRPGRRGDVERVELLFEDALAFGGWVRDRAGDVPVFWVGESMGALLLLNLAVERPEGVAAAGHLFLSPVVCVRLTTPPWQEFIARILMRAAPWVRLPRRFFVGSRKKKEPPGHVSRDAAWQEKVSKPPYRGPGYTLRFYKMLERLIAGAAVAPERLRVPSLLMYAGDDVFIRPEHSVAWFTRITCEKASAYFPQSYHMLLHDPDTPRALEEIRGFIEARLRAPGNDITGTSRG